ncbi:BCR, YceG family protein [Tamilnaduibacter salinus]|uniref:Endolytic murein transglycosylase n=1 Tax=Tamilnaduibacter salinus TaxID=1484056 RepID=A0A2A2I8M6_9GAMM|nr:endolytic transglycosylase MltG [Tamilnaduibacter salinus]PAV27475.1 BCR, YceG family protein [Tamilnaduibacter salinus]
MIRKLIVMMLLLGLIGGGAAGVWLWRGYQSLQSPLSFEGPVLFSVERGQSFTQVAGRLKDAGVIDNAFWLRLWGRLNPGQSVIRAGDYELRDGMTALGILEAFRKGDVKTWSVQFIEGWRFREMRQALADHPRLDHTLSEPSDKALMAALGFPDQHPEGRFFPDTYQFSSSATDLDILRRAHQRMSDILAEAWKNRADGLPYDDAYEALIMASIIEKETGVAGERHRIAGVFVRRLNRGMRLQTDPTVIYGMGESYDGNITRADLQRHSPYNTYRIDGLPPTPIAMPGEKAIQAALNPAEGTALYFVARGDGSHVFSDTLEAHNRAVREYQLQRRSDYRSSPGPTEE